MNALARILSILMLSVFAGTITNGQNPSAISISSEPLYTKKFTCSYSYSNIRGLEWGDYNNDGLLDFLIRSISTSDIYTNIGNSFFTPHTSYGLLPGDSPIIWGDYDNDDDLDLLVVDKSSGHYYRGNRIMNNNTDRSFTDLFDPLISESIEGNVDWIDIDNDGDFDIIGNGSSGLTSYLYEPGIRYAEMMDGAIPDARNWHIGDYNNDNFPDVLSSGFDFSGNYLTKIYRNNKNGSFTDIEAGLPGVTGGSLKWGDYDCDGDLDILLSGRNNFSNYITKVFKNNGDDIFTEVEGLNLVGGSQSVALWGDYDCDGDLDILFTGYNSDFSGCIVMIYDNLGDDSFVEQQMISFDVACPSSAAWGDYDMDGDLDLIINNEVYQNTISDINSKPEIPIGLNSEVHGSNVLLSWEASTDDETPSAGLSYSIAVATKVNGIDILNPEADLASGRRKKAEMGNSGLTPSHHLKKLEPGTYYWSVQAIDNSFIGSEFSEWEEFTILPAFTRLIEDMEMLLNSSVSWGDLDNDGDLDLLLSGSFNNSALLKLYENIGSDQFSEFLDLTLEGDWDGSSVLGDYDNDGDLDMLFSYSKQDETYLYQNLGEKTFEQVEINIPGLDSCDISWGDFDNDGDLDFGICGMNSEDIPVTKIYKNSGSIFEEQDEIVLTGVCNGTISWIDYDLDSDLDLFIAGQSENSILSVLYKNQGEGVFLEIPDAGIEGVFNSSVDWGDYDNDGDPDLLLGGHDSDGKRITYIYRNMGDDVFSKSSAEIQGINFGSARWGDLDCDGDLDILLTGFSTFRADVFRNDGNENFELINAAFFSAAFGSQGMWGDYDNDGDLDVVISGYDDKVELTNVYTNNGNWDNQAPDPPDNLQFKQYGLGIQFSWDAASDDQTPVSALSYNLRVGITPGGSDIISPHSSPETERLTIPAQGNCGQNRSWTLSYIPEGDYYWSVQAVDHTFNCGAWAEEQNFSTSAIRADFSADTVCVGNETVFTDLTQSTNATIEQWVWDFGDGFTSNLQHPVHLYNEAGSYDVKLLCISNDSEQFISKHVVVKPAPEVNFTYDVVSLGEYTTFINTSYSGGIDIVQWDWDFGDGSSFSGEIPDIHKYLETGMYDVSLSATSDFACSAEVIKSVSVCLEALKKPEIVGSGPNLIYLACSNDSTNFYRWYHNNELIDEAVSYIYIPEVRSGDFRVEISNGGICFSSSDPYNLSQLTAVNDLDPWKHLKIYPNPTPGMFTLEMDNHIMGELIIDIFGETGIQIINIKFHKETAHFKTEIDLSSQPAAMYLIKLFLEKYAATRTLIVE